MPRQPLRPEPKPVAVALLVPGLALASVAGAQSGVPAELETVTVTATRLPREAAGSTTTVLDTATLALRNKPGLPELLADVAGLHATQPGGRGSVGELLTRGGEPNFTAVLIDGIEMNDPTNTRGGSFDFSTLDVNEVQSVEIARGPLSSIYGSDALSGLINIVTHRPSDTPSSDVTLTLGTDALARAGLRLAGPVSSQARYAVSASSIRDGHRDDESGNRSTAFSGSLELAPSRPSSLTIDARHSDTVMHAFPDSSGGPSFAALREQDERHARDTTLGFRWRRPLTEHAELHARAARLDHDEEIRSPGVAAGPGGAIPPNRSSAEFARETLSVYVTSAAGPRLSTAVGFDYERQHGASEGFITVAPGVELPASYDLTRSTAAVFAELGFALSPTLDIAAAVRLDDADASDRESTGRIGASWSVTDETRLRWSVAQGFKQPSLFSIGDPLVGNPDLVAETVTSWELGADFGGSEAAFSAAITVFRQRFDDLIDFDFDAFTTVNRDSVDADGLEFAGRWQLAAHTALLAHGTWVDLDVIDSEQTLRLRPERRGGVGIEWLPTMRASVYAGWRYVGERLDAAIPTGERWLPSYGRVDVSVSWQLTPSRTLQVAIDNLTDERYEDAIGFPSLGTRLRITLRAGLL